MPQEDINALLVERGRSGQTVVRLKGGDPFVFARGGEEAAALAEAGVPFEIVPGITSAIAVPAYAGIPVTLRHCSTCSPSSPATRTRRSARTAPSTGRPSRRSAARSSSSWAWPASGRSPRELIAGGLSADTPVAAVRWGTRPEQHTVRATLGTIADAAAGVAVGDRRSARSRAWTSPGSSRARCSAARSSSPAPGRRRRSCRRALRCRGRRGDRGAGDRDRRPGRRWSCAAAWPPGARPLRLGRPHLAERRRRLLAAIDQSAATPGRSAPRRWPPSARHGGGARRAAASSPTSCPSGSWPRRCSTRSLAAERRRTACCSPRRGGAATCCPTGCGRSAGRSTSSRPTAPCRPPHRRAARRGRRRRRRHLHVVVHGHRFARAFGADAVPPRGRVHRSGHRRHGPRRTA